uniref:Ig-like domain-containing protein n=1 Tax=Xenopus tropicalis TaxID=8364 RepID=A0A803JEH8_XENTR
MFAHPTALLIKETANCSLGSAVRPVVSFLPNWDTIFIGDFVSVKCELASTAHKDQIYYWYKDNVYLHKGQPSFFISSATLMDGGDYQCQTGTSLKSDSVRLSISQEYVILQKPPVVYEGDTLILRCHSFPGYKSKETTFYKHGTVLRSLGDLYSGDCTTGRYKCSKYVHHAQGFHFYSAEAYISAKELFSKPEMIANPRQITEGADGTLTCSSSLSPARAATKLQFAFYKDGRTVQDFTPYRTFQLSLAQLEHSGGYTCEARTLSHGVRKMSGILKVFISELFSTPELNMSSNPIAEDSEMTLNCIMQKLIRQNTELQFAFYRNGEKVQNFSAFNKYHILSTQLADSGVYVCKVQTLNSSVKKSSQELEIQIQGKQRTSALLIARVVLFPLLLVGSVLLFSYKLKLFSACWTSQPQQDSPSQAANTDVSYATLKTRLTPTN